MILLFDAGNTRLKWAIADLDFSLTEVGVLEYSELGMAKAIPIDADTVTRIAVSSVAGIKRDNQLKRFCLGSFGVMPVFAKVAVSGCGVRNDYLAIDRLGVDRWVAALGAVEEVSEKENRIIVDAGTAVTVDVLDRDCVFRGGVILPGEKLMHDSLVGKAAGIHSNRQPVVKVIGRDTQQCVNAGARYGLVGAVDRIIEECVSSIDNNSPWKVIVCGGDALWLTELMKTSLAVSVQPSLIFNGLLCLLRSGELK